MEQQSRQSHPIDEGVQRLTALGAEKTVAAADIARGDDAEYRDNNA
jgi:hypothetical protein